MNDPNRHDKNALLGLGLTVLAFLIVLALTAIPVEPAKADPMPTQAPRCDTLEQRLHDVTNTYAVTLTALGPLVSSKDKTPLLAGYRTYVIRSKTWDGGVVLRVNEKTNCLEASLSVVFKDAAQLEAFLNRTTIQAKA